MHFAKNTLVTLVTVIYAFPLFDATELWYVSNINRQRMPRSLINVGRTFGEFSSLPTTEEKCDWLIFLFASFCR